MNCPRIRPLLYLSKPSARQAMPYRQKPISYMSFPATTQTSPSHTFAYTDSPCLSIYN
ncbi:hypothetical protein EMIT0111MI5_30206 [Burkholderia sp. IT-111MI5]